jgi:hypothetical protein
MNWELLALIYFALVFFACVFLDDGYRDYFIDIFFPIRMAVNFFKWAFRERVFNAM